MTGSERVAGAAVSPNTAKTYAGPRGHWLWGCMPQIQKDGPGFYIQAWRDYGDYVPIRAVPGVYLHLLAHPDAVEHVLYKNHKNYRKPTFLTGPMSLLVGQRLFTSAGDLWLRQRRLAQPAFHRDHLTKLVPLMSEAAASFLREREGAEAGQIVDLLDEMMRLTFEIAGATLVSTDLGMDAGAIGKAYRSAFEWLNYKMGSPWRPPVWVPTRRNRQFAQAKQSIDRMVLQIIESRRRAARKPDDLLTMLLKAQDETTGAGMSDQQLKDEILTLLTAGHETTGAALAWAWYLLGLYPQVQEALHDEAHGCLQGRSPTAEDLPHLPLARAVFEEAMRLYPPAYGLPRQAIEADDINGYSIPARSIVVICQYVTHRHPDFWEEPEVFKPERFLPSQSCPRPKFAYFPFGGGPRGCIGNTFALMEGQLVLASALQKFRLALVPGHPVVTDATFTLRPKFGVKGLLHRR